MKKLTSVLLAMLIGTTLFAKQDPFKKHKKQNAEFQKSVNEFKKLTRVAGQEYIPGVVKMSFWDEGNNSWMPTNAHTFEVSNSRVVTSYTLSYNLSDTFSKYSYTYDVQGRYASTYYEEKDPMTGKMIPNNRSTITYSTDGLKQTVVMENYDTSSKAWYYSGKFILAKNDRGVEINTTSYFHDGNNWQMSYSFSRKITYLNSTTLKTTEIIDSVFDFNLNQMIAVFKETQNYDGNGRVIDIRTYEQGNTPGSLVYAIQDSVFYDANGMPVRFIEKIIDAQGNASNDFMYDEVTFMNFNANTDLFENDPSGFKYYSATQSGWVLEGRLSTNVLDNNGSYQELEEAYISGNYVPAGRYTEMYNNQKEFIEEKYEWYNDTTNSWIVDFGMKYIITYDANNRRLEAIHQNYNTNTNQYVNANREEYSNYLLINTGINNNKNDELSIYPNPVSSNTINIKNNNISNSEAKIKIIDMNGRIIQSESISLNNSILNLNLINIETGIYFLKLETAIGSKIVKFIKE
jgi:hypothetical protein